jgi:EmrB/QacA subfamily drug resistance transporter
MRIWCIDEFERDAHRPHGRTLNAAGASPTPAVAVDVDIERRRRWTLIATIIGSSMTFIDATVVNIALPTIGRDLDAGLTAQQWVMLSYSLAVASLYIVSGALGDRYGRRVLFAGGAAGFAAASALAGLAPTTSVLIAARVLQGISGALLTTNSLALLRATYAADSGRAVGLWTAWSGIGTLAGPPLGGLIVQYASWRLIFFINLPAAAVALVLAWLGRIDEGQGEAQRIDVIEAVAAAVTFGGLTYVLVEASQAGVRSVVPWIGLTVAGAAVFAFRQLRSPAPLVPRTLFRERLFLVANLCTFLVYAALGGSTFYLALYLQSQDVGYTPLRASLVFVPVSVLMFFLAARFGRLADRDGPRRYLTLGPLAMAAGMLFLTLVTDTNPLRPVPGVLLFAFGLSMTVAPITSTALKAAPASESGVAAGVNTTVSRLGGLLATPVLGIVIVAVFSASTGAHHGDPFATSGVSADAQAAATSAFRAAMLVAAGLCAAGALVALRWLPSGPQH